MGWGKNLYQLVKIPIIRPCKGYYLRWYYNGWHYWFFKPGRYSVKTEGEQYRTIGTRIIQVGSGQIDRGQAPAIRTIMNTREVYLLTLAGWMNIRVTPGSVIVYDNRQEGVEIEMEITIGSKEISYETGYTPVPGDGSLPDIPIVPPTYDLCEIIIGSQIWLCKNFNSNYPGSKVYNNDEANRVIFGGLYTWAMINNPGFVPSGWHIPTLAEWGKLLDYLGGTTVAGGHLKEVGFDHWNAPNTGADNYASFTALGAGWANILAQFFGLYGYSVFWCANEYDENYAYAIQLGYNTAVALVTHLSKFNYSSVRLVKDTPAPPVPVDDWFLPSKDELALIYTELYTHGVGSYSNVAYWSSSEASIPAVLAWYQYFQTGVQFESVKSYHAFVIPVRAFTSISVYNIRDIGPAGGYIIYTFDNGDGTYDYIEAWPESIGYEVFSNIVAAAAGTGTAVGTGQANTTAIISQGGHTISAAKFCDDFES